MNKKIGTIYLILIFGLIIRLSLSFLPAFEADQNAFRFWVNRLATVGFADFYTPYVFTNNPLGIMYFFWIIGVLKTTVLSSIISSSNIDIFLKLAGNTADLITGFLIYKIIKEKLTDKAGIIAAMLYIFNPGLTFNSAVWGQYDSIAILFLVLCIYYCLIKRSPILSSIFFSLACVTKPQAVALVPFLLFFYLKNYSPIKWLYSLFAFILTATVVFLPFFPDNPFYGMYYVNSGSTTLYNCTSCNALNLWGIIGNWKNDSELFLKLPLLYWSIILLSICLIVIFSFRRLKGNILFLTASLSILSFFMLLTRMHERYSVYFFPFMLISAILLKSKILMSFYIFFSFILLLNLYIPYAYYNNMVKITNLPPIDLFTDFSRISIISFFGFVLLFVYYLYYVKKHSDF